MNRKLSLGVAGSVLLIQVVLWVASSSGAMAAEAWAQTILHLAAKMEPQEKPVDILLCDELQEHLSTERFGEVGSALARFQATLYYESEAPPHERGDGSSIYNCAEANWSIPITGNAYVTYFGHDWNGDEVWMAFVFGRWLRVTSYMAWM